MYGFYHDEYKLTDVMWRLEHERSGISLEQLDEDILVAIDCIRYVINKLREESDS